MITNNCNDNPTDKKGSSAEDSLIAGMMNQLMQNAMRLTELIIDNRLRNNQIIEDDEEIVEIYKDVFTDLLINNIETMGDNLEEAYEEDEEESLNF